MGDRRTQSRTRPRWPLARRAPGPPISCGRARRGARRTRTLPLMTLLPSHAPGSRPAVSRARARRPAHHGRRARAARHDRRPLLDAEPARRSSARPSAPAAAHRPRPTSTASTASRSPPARTPSPSHTSATTRRRSRAWASHEADRPHRPPTRARRGRPRRGRRAGGGHRGNQHGRVGPRGPGRAPAILDGISAQQIRRSPDATSGEALRRVTGVTVTGGKFVTIRGVPERYNTTLLNGAPVPSTEPDRRAFAFDLIPSNLLANVLVAKTRHAGPARRRRRRRPGAHDGRLPRGAHDLAERLDGRPQRDRRALRDGHAGRPRRACRPTSAGPAVTDEQRADFGRELAGGFVLGPETGTVRPNASFSIGGSQMTALGRIGAVGAVSFRSGYAFNTATRREYESTGERASTTRARRPATARRPAACSTSRGGRRRSPRSASRTSTTGRSRTT